MDVGLIFRDTSANATGGSLRIQLQAEEARPPKLVHVVRHGEAEHNVDARMLKRRDTILTPKGRAQADALRTKMQELAPEVVLTSPILRALQTTAGFVDKGTPVIVVPDARERVSRRSHLCEMPLNPETFVMGGEELLSFDWSLVREAIESAGGGCARWEEELKACDLEGDCRIEERGRRLSAYLEQRPEATICLVSHGGFLEYLTKDYYMGNCELRTYALSGGRWTPTSPPEKPRNDALAETQSSSQPSARFGAKSANSDIVGAQATERSDACLKGDTNSFFHSGCLATAMATCMGAWQLTAHLAWRVCRPLSG